MATWTPIENVILQKYLWQEMLNDRYHCALQPMTDVQAYLKMVDTTITNLEDGPYMIIMPVIGPKRMGECALAQAGKTLPVLVEEWKAICEAGI